MPALNRLHIRDERGVVMVLFAVLLPVILIMTAVVWDAGNWWVHRKHLQTKVDAAAFAGGGVWSFPCVPATDANIEAVARKFVGVHTQANGAVYNTTTFNPQVGGKTNQTKIHVILNGSNWYDDDSNPSQVDLNDPSNTSLCASKTLDVKGTETNNTPLFGWLPYFPDIKRRARIEIQEIEGITGLLPIAVRVPKPLGIAAVFYDETPGANYGRILDNGDAVKFFCEDNGFFGLPAGLGGWTTWNTSDPACSYTSWGQFAVTENTGIAIASSFRPRCGAPGATSPCFQGTGFTTVNELCNQGGNTQIVQCFYANGTFPSQTVQSGLHFIRGYQTGNVGNGPPMLRSAWLDTPSANCYSYFNAPITGSCSAALHANVDIGSYDPPGPLPETRTTANTEVRYKLVYGNTSDAGSGSGGCGTNYGIQCDMSPSWVASLNFLPQYTRHAVAIRVALRNTTIFDPPNPPVACNATGSNCRYYFTAAGRSGNVPTQAQIFANPVQRAFMGNIDDTGPIKWLRLTQGDVSGGVCVPTAQDGPAASATTGSTHCFYVEMGLKGGTARDQDEPPISFNEGSGSSQMGSVDCDPNIQQGQILTEGIIKGCSPWYAANKFNHPPGPNGDICPDPNDIFDQPNPGPPWNYWPPLDCIKSRPTGSMNQMEAGLNERIFGDPTNPQCPTDDATKWVKGRNYWHRDNNMYVYDPTDPTSGANFKWDADTPNTTLDDWPNKLRQDDPRLVTLFFSTYDSFTTTGQKTYPVTGFGVFYITGYGRVQGGGLNMEDPCDTGNDGNLYNGNGNEPPPDLISTGGNTSGTVVWGHFISNVSPNPNATPSGTLCNEAGLMPCVATLVE